jgi:hypothetical protein
MKISVRKMLVLLAIVLSFTTIQSVWAGSCNGTYSGTISAINYDDNSITIDKDTTIYGIPLSYLVNKLKIELEVGNTVVMTTYLCPNTGLITACTLKVGEGDIIILPGKRS